jgi:hypothetical protein
MNTNSYNNLKFKKIKIETFPEFKKLSRFGSSPNKNKNSLSDTISPGYSDEEDPSEESDMDNFEF